MCIRDRISRAPGLLLHPDHAAGTLLSKPVRKDPEGTAFLSMLWPLPTDEESDRDSIDLPRILSAAKLFWKEMNKNVRLRNNENPMNQGGNLLEHFGRVFRLKLLSEIY